MRQDLPSGTVTFLFTDVEDSTQLLHELGAESYAAALAEHRRVIRESCAAHGGVEVDTQGDAFFVAFPTAPGAVAAATEALGGLATGPIQVRIGVHTGTPHVGEEGYVGMDVHRAARIAACGHGGQVLLSSSAASLLGSSVLHDLGEHRLKGLAAAERIYQFGDTDFPPLESLGQTSPPLLPTPVPTSLDTGQTVELVVRGPEQSAAERIPLSGNRVLVGRLPDVNDIALQPDTQLLVTRGAHCTLEREGARWFVVDGGSVNGTFLRRGGRLERVTERTALHDGDVICVLASITDTNTRRFFELAFQASGDSRATRMAPIPGTTPSTTSAPPCLRYDVHEARLVLVRGNEQDEIPLRRQADRLVRYMAERNAAAGPPALCTPDELLQAVWANEPMRTSAELARLVMELRRALEPFGAEDLVESELRSGYRLRTCRADAEEV